MKKLIGAVAIATAVAGWSTVASAEDYGLADAHVAGEEAFRSAIVGAIAQKPLEVDSIVSEAVAVAPDQSELIKLTVIEYFPGFEEKVTTLVAVPAAGDVAVDTSVETEEVADAAPEDLPEEISEEPIIGEATFSNWAGELAFGLSSSEGNTEEQGINFEGTLNQERGKWQNQLYGSFDFSSTSGTVTERRLEVDFETRRDHNEFIYVYGFLKYEDDSFSGFEYRFTESAGLGWRIVENDVWGIDFQGGPSIVQTRPINNGSFTSRVGGRIASNAYWNWTDDTALTNEFSLNADVDRIYTEDKLALTTKLYGNLAGRASIKLTNDSSPALGTVPNDLLTRVTLVYTLN